MSVQRGLALRYFRRDVRHWTQGRLAIEAQVHVNTIGRLETRGIGDRAVYVKVRRALDVTEDQIQQWIASRPIDRRLRPLVVWFEALPSRDQDLIGQTLQLLVHRAERTKDHP